MHRRALESFAVIALCAALGAGAARAQDSADSKVTISKVDQVQVTKVDDILIGVFTSDAELQRRTYRSDQFDYQCVYSTTGGYRLDVAGTNGNGPFTLVSDSGDAMRYEVHLWFRPAGGEFQYTSTRYTRGPIAVPGLSASRSPTCADEGLDQSNLIVTGVVDRGPFNRAPPGVYRDVLTITVSPE